VNITELVIFVVLFLAVTVLGFLAARWRRPVTMDHLDEWGLAGRNFGSWVTFFLVGGDLYTAYTFVAVPALVYGAGAIGFYALPYTVILYPMVYLLVIRLWSVSHVHGFVTPADFVRARFGSPTLALVVAITGIVATMPYIALQLTGIQVVLASIGLHGDWPLIVAFAVLAAYTYQSGLRAPALIAFVKDLLIYAVILVAVIYVPTRLGGWGHIFDSAQTKFTKAHAGGITLHGSDQLQYATLALGSAMALFLYPHSITGALASKSRGVIKRNMSALPAYSFLLALLALLGYAAIAAGVKPLVSNGKANSSTIVPELFQHLFPSWFTGIAFAAIAIGALVPAAIMSIAAANLFTRNIYKEYIRRDASPSEEAKVSKAASLVVKLGALVAILALNPQFSINLQLIGGAIVLQTLPPVALGLYTRWFHRTGLVIGLVAGLVAALWMLWEIPNAAVHQAHFGGSAFALSHLGLHTKATMYPGLLALVVNLVVAAVITLIVRAVKVPDGTDSTQTDDYFFDTTEPGGKPKIEVVI